MGVKFNPIILFLALATAPGAFALEKLDWENPRWQWLGSKDIDTRVVDEREILVRTKTADRRTLLQGAGFVKAECARVAAAAAKYDSYREVTGLFESVEWNPATNVLTLKFNVLGFRYAMSVEMESSAAAMNGRIRKGIFEGMLGTLKFSPRGAGCLVEMRSWTASEKPLGALTQLLAEQIMYKGARSMREHLERNP